MTKYQRAQIKMAGAVNRTMADQATLVATLPLLGTALANFNQKLGEVRTTGRATEPIPPQVAEDKEARLDKAIVEVWKVAGAVQAWASITGDAVLAGRNDVSRADLRAISDDKIVARLEGIMTDARTHLPALAAAGLTAALLDDVDDLIDHAEQGLGNPREAIGGRSAAVVLLEEQLRGLMKIATEQLDRLMRQFFVEPDSPEKIARRNFYELYQAARVIVETPGGGSGTTAVPPTSPGTAAPTGKPATAGGGS
jgi:hypothetical protein